jgi:HEAT repeat protein
MIPIFIQFAEFSLAGKLLLQLQSLSQKLIQAKDKRAYLLLKTLKIQLEPQTQRMIINDLKSNNTSNQKKAIQFLGCMGDASIPILIDLIKKEEDFRIRNFATSLLEGQKPGSVDALKRELLMNIKPEQRVRILEVIDRLTHDLKDSLILLLCDSNPQVQDAAFQLAERLDEKYVTEILLKCAKSQEINLATAAIESLGRLKIRSASRELLSLLKSAKKEELIIACCRTLGQIKDPDGIDPLNKLLKQKSFFGFCKRRSADVRTAAAMALAQIPHPKGIQVLAAFMEDPELRVREIAKVAVNHNQSVRSS